ncbi:hypothetical protein AAC387_Pa03g4233 [Persea americana]
MEVPDQLLSDLAEDPDLLHHYIRNIPFTRDVTAIVDAPFPPISIATFPHTNVRNVLDEKRAEGLWSTTERDSLVHTFLSPVNLSHNNWTNLETQVSLCLFNLVSTAKEEGYIAIDVVLFIEAETVDAYDEEEVAWAMRELASVANPAPRSSVEALPSQVLDDRISSDKCTICLDEYSRGAILTQLPCSHDFHGGCIEKWLNESNSCPICRSPI